jgi:sulfur relay (sulfurtransferase) DsrC/TusE family protein
MIYDTSKVIDVLTLEEVLKHTTEYDIYSYYLGSKFDVGKIMSSPFRQDLKPSFGIFKDKSNTALLWKDQATGETGNIITFVKKYKNLYRNSQALKLIWDEVVKGHLKISERGKEVVEHYSSTKTIISIKRKNFTDTDDEYWGQYNITRETLNKFNVVPILHFWINDTMQSLVYSKDCPMYAYRIFDKFKIYRPLSTFKKDKWRTNCSSIDLQGYEQLPTKGNLLIITKSLKDVMVLYQLGYNSVALQSENDHLNKDILLDLQKRFKRIVIFFDNDIPGFESAVKLSEKYNLQYVNIDSSQLELYQVKDISDYMVVWGSTKTVKLFKSLIDNLVLPKEKVSQNAPEGHPR